MTNLWNVVNRLSCFLAKRPLCLKQKKNVSPESHAAEKRQLVNEIVSLKKMADLHDRDSARRDLQVHQYKSEADKGLTALQDAERKVQNYRVEVRCGFNCFWNSREIGITPLETRILSREKKTHKLKNSFFKVNFKFNLTHGTAKRWKKLRCMLCENHGTVTDLDEFARLKNGALDTDENNRLAQFVQFLKKKKKKELKEQSVKQSTTKPVKQGAKFD